MLEELRIVKKEFGELAKSVRVTDQIKNQRTLRAKFRNVIHATRNIIEFTLRTHKRNNDRLRLNSANFCLIKMRTDSRATYG